MSNTYYIHYKTGSKYIALFPCELCEQQNESNPSVHCLENEEDDALRANVCAACYDKMAQEFKLVECPWGRCQMCGKGMFPPVVPLCADHDGESDQDE